MKLELDFENKVISINGKFKVMEQLTLIESFLEKGLIDESWVIGSEVIVNYTYPYTNPILEFYPSYSGNGMVSNNQCNKCDPLTGCTCSTSE